MNLGYGLSFKNLYSLDSIKRVDEIFLNFLRLENDEIYEYLLHERSKNFTFGENSLDNNVYFIEGIKIFESFLLTLFRETVSSYNITLEQYKQFDKILQFRKTFTNKYVKPIDISNYDFVSIKILIFQELNLQNYNEEKIIQATLQWLESPDKYNEQLHNMAVFGAFLMKYSHLEPSQQLFFKATKTNFDNLFNYNHSPQGTISKTDTDLAIIREDFNLYNYSKMYEAIHESNYCVKCHVRGNDYCKTGEPNKEQTSYNKNPLDITLHGCPLSMHISEMHELFAKGNILGALIAITINNPLVAGTGENICNDCTTSCIYQKQQAVDTPKVESFILKSILALDYGFEIYSLLTRYNPFRFHQVYPETQQNKNVLVVGLGPAGYSLAYTLAHKGYGVVGIDSMKLEPLPSKLVKDFCEIKNINEIYENLDNRIIDGFGGVSEYGITSRWDKNLLKVLRIILERQDNICLLGGIRFGSNIDFTDVKPLGFQHVALCMGAGKPNIIASQKNILSKGVRTSSEFLMNLHGGAYQSNNFLNLQVELPLVVLGCGLTAVDCATEALLYYQRLLKKYILPYSSYSFDEKQEFLQTLSIEDSSKLKIYEQHYKLLEESQDKIATLQIIGGVTIVYHKDIKQSKAYRINAHELHSALKQGVKIQDNTVLKEIILDEFGGIKELKCLYNNEQIITIPAKNMILALGTNPNNIVIEEFQEYFPNSINLDFKPERLRTFKNQQFNCLLQDSYKDIDVSFFGDMHKVFNGSVVKALASSFYGQYDVIDSLKQHSAIKQSFQEVATHVVQCLESSVLDVQHINDKIHEITFYAPQVAKKLKAGQFIKVQNYVSNISPTMEPLILGAFPHTENTLKAIVLQSGTSSTISKKLARNSKIVLQGPLGEPTLLPYKKNVLLIGGGVGNATIFSILKQLHEQENIINYIAGFKDYNDVIYMDYIKKYSNTVITSIENNNHNKEYLTGNILNALSLFVKNNPNAEKDIHYIFIAGSCGMMECCKDFLKNHSFNAEIVFSLNAPMNCTNKGVCGACIQQNNLGQFFYGCQQQEQNIQNANLKFLRHRLEQQSLIEKISMLSLKKSL